MYRRIYETSVITTCPTNLYSASKERAAILKHAKRSLDVHIIRLAKSSSEHLWEFKFCVVFFSHMLMTIKVNFGMIFKNYSTPGISSSLFISTWLWAFISIFGINSPEI